MAYNTKRALARRINLLYGHLRAAGCSEFLTKGHCMAHVRSYAAEYFRLYDLQGWHSLTLNQLHSYHCELEQILCVQLFTYYLDSWVGETAVDLARATGKRTEKIFAMSELFC